MLGVAIVSDIRFVVICTYILANQTPQVAPLAATIKLLRARPKHRVHTARIGIWMKHRLPIFYLLPGRLLDVKGHTFKIIFHPSKRIIDGR